MGGDQTPRPSEWEKFPVQARPRRYFFHGEHRNPAGSTWNRDAAVGHSYDIYENGTLSRVGWDDTGGDMDLNDLIVDNSQALEMANIYTNILSSTLDAFASIIANNQNEVLKRLSVITMPLRRITTRLGRSS